MGKHTANAGRIYFPAGMADMNDVKDGKVDFGASVWRELAEETGLTAADVTEAPGWHTVFAGPRIGQIKTLHARESAEALRERILAFTAQDKEPELSDIVIVRKPSDCNDKVAPFVVAFLKAAWSSSG
jgi:hypothetical protein